MSEWAGSRHAYGSAEDVPELLERLAAAPTAELWDDLWSALCHQGSVCSASFAALPWLSARAAGEQDRAQRRHALLLAGAIVAGAEQVRGGGVERYGGEVAVLRGCAERELAGPADPVEYAYLLQTVLGLEEVPVWGEELAAGLTSGEYEVACPGCGAGLFVAFGGYGHFAASGDYALVEGVPRSPLRPADPAALTGLGRRLYGWADAHGQHEVATALRHVFGAADCPECGAGFAVAEQVCGGADAVGG